jgi:hypothetical protein
MSIQHFYSQTVADGTATSVVRPSDWNSSHKIVYNLSGNTVGSSQITGNDVILVGGNNVTLSADTANSKLVFSAAAGGGGGGAAPDRFFKEIIQGERLTTIVGMSATNVTNRPLFLPFFMEGTGLQANTARFLMSMGASSNRSLGGTFYCGLYSLNNSTQMTLLASDSFSVSSTASASSASWNGVNWIDFTGMSGFTATAEGRYMMALMVRPVSANVTWMPVSLYGADNMPVQSRVMQGNAGAASMNALASNSQFVPFWGAYSTTTGALPDTVGITQINGASSQFQFQYYANIREN